ncbi:MAG TPA: hypothetical protein VM077_00165 [Candidatus Limnocylindrales bacterium]|nr:hypothetical protein [Candidatus Limnocylindrales bacterium]
MAETDTIEVDTQNLGKLIDHLPTETHVKEEITPKSLELTEAEQGKKDEMLKKLDRIKQQLAEASERTNTVDDKRTLEELRAETERAKEMETPTMDSLIADRYKKNNLT